jgi:hypothetical protein
VHLQVFHETLKIPKSWSIPGRTLAAAATAPRPDAGIPVVRRPASRRSLCSTEETAKGSNFAFSGRSAAADVIDVSLEVNVRFGEKDLSSVSYSRLKRGDLTCPSITHSSASTHANLVIQYLLFLAFLPLLIRSISYSDHRCQWTFKVTFLTLPIRNQ